ncbi:MAG: SpoIIIAH-like family protein [Clostridia bacterium]|nr:SpoIIIAH-like family protein [Clostridia bacterium]
MEVSIMSNKKKIIIICTMVVLLVAAAYLNVLLNNKQSQVNLGDNTVTTVSYFSAIRSDRDSTRAQSFSYLDAIINSENSTEAVVATAQAKKMELINFAEQEMVLEGLIKARGFEDAYVTLETSNVNVVVKDSELDSADVAQILSIITAETGCSPTNVIIVPYN